MATDILIGRVSRYTTDGELFINVSSLGFGREIGPVDKLPGDYRNPTEEVTQKVVCAREGHTYENLLVLGPLVVFNEDIQELGGILWFKDHQTMIDYLPSKSGVVGYVATEGKLYLWNGVAWGAFTLPAGGLTGQALVKATGADYDAVWRALNKSDVGLGNVDNTSDANKPVSTAANTRFTSVEIDVANLKNRPAINSRTVISNTAAVNLNTYTTTGFFAFRAPTSGSGLVTNVPDPVALGVPEAFGNMNQIDWNLDVNRVGTGSIGYQQLYAYSSAGLAFQFSRKFSGTVFGAWDYVATGQTSQPRMTLNRNALDNYNLDNGKMGTSPVDFRVGNTTTGTTTPSGSMPLNRDATAHTANVHTLYTENPTGFRSELAMLYDGTIQSRSYTGSSWNAWRIVHSSRGSLGTYNLNDIKTNGEWEQLTGGATLARNYPVVSLGFLSVVRFTEIGSGNVLQRYTTFSDVVYQRQFDGSTWSTWKIVAQPIEDTGMVVPPFTPAAGWSMSADTYIRASYGAVDLVMHLDRTGAGTTVANTNVGNIASPWRPAQCTAISGAKCNSGGLYGVAEINTAGNLWVSMAGTVPTGSYIGFTFRWIR